MPYLSFQTMYERCQKVSIDSDTDSLALFKEWINEGKTKAEAALDETYFLTDATDLTVADQTSYPLPFNSAKLDSMYITVAGADYPILEYTGSVEQWRALIGGVTTATTSDFPTWFHVKKDTYEIYPATASSGNTITVTYKLTTKDLSIDDFTTESVKTATNGSTAIVGNTNSAWTTAMKGRYIRITSDGIWYEIASVTDATNLVLVREFGGTAITAGTEAYIIGEMSLIPEPYQILPVYYALKEYFAQKRKFTLADKWEKKWETDLEKMVRYGSNSTTSEVLESDVV